MAYSIMLDAGHGGSDPGAVYKGRQEKDDNLSLTKAVGEILEKNGVKVLYTRTEDEYLTPFERAKQANEADVDYFISFHRNSSPQANQYQGVEVLVYNKSGIKYKMAQNIVGALGELGFQELGVKERPGLVVLRRTKMPALLIETGFINSEKDNQLFDEKFKEIAKSIADAILGTLDDEKVDTPLYYRVQTGAFRNRENADRMLYQLAKALHVSIRYLKDDTCENPREDIEKDIYILEAQNEYGARDARNVAALLAENQALFAGGELSQTEKDLFFEALMTAYVTSKQQAKEKYGKKKS